MLHTHLAYTHGQGQLSHIGHHDVRSQLSTVRPQCDSFPHVSFSQLPTMAAGCGRCRHEEQTSLQVSQCLLQQVAMTSTLIACS